MFFFKLKQDLLAQSGDSLVNKIKVFFFSHTYHMIILIRLGQILRSTPVLGGVMGTILEYIVRVVYSSDISSKATLGAGLNLMHGHDIVIGSNVIIGENAKVFNGVTLGNKNTNTTDIEQPVIGDNVTICTGAKVLGYVKIGNNSIVGANSVVTKNIPENEIWAGVPAKKIKKNERYE